MMYRPVEMWWHTRRNQISSFGPKRTSPFKSAGGRQFSRLLTAELCASAEVMLDTPCSEVVWRVLATHCIHQFPNHLPSLRHLVPSHFNWTLATSLMTCSCGSNDGYTMFRGSVKGTGYPLHSPVSQSLALPASPCAITFQLESSNQKVVQSKHNNILNNVQFATCFGYSNHHQVDISLHGHDMLSV